MIFFSSPKPSTARSGSLLNVNESVTVYFLFFGFNYANGQTLTGNLVCNGIGTINARMQNNSTLTGSVNPSNTTKILNLIIDSTSKWNVTADSYLTTLSNIGGISGDTITNIYGNGHTVYYDNAACPGLGGKTYNLNGGGCLKPIN